MSPTVVSAPGKALLTGGYLVLDKHYSGLVVATSARFYSVVRRTSLHPNSIRVRSPQFVHAEWPYRVAFNKDTRSPHVTPAGSKNKFVQLAIECTLQLVWERSGSDPLSFLDESGLDIVIVADNDFYSQKQTLDSRGLPRTTASMASLEPFLPVQTTLADVHKTGLGSSAALTTSLITSLLMEFGEIHSASFEDPNSVDLQLTHNLSQYVHCLAQGKVGSGFDVSSAIYGSHIYTRFDPAILAPLMESQSLLRLSPIIDPTKRSWDMLRVAFKLPPMIRLVLADVDAGSDTPSLVGKVLKWRSSYADEAFLLWNKLDEHNRRVPALLNRLVDLYHIDPVVYSAALRKASELSSESWPEVVSPDEEGLVFSCLVQLSDAIKIIRSHLRTMGSQAEVPIEPKEQTLVLDQSCKVPGVLGAGVPGAGGYDALWALILAPHGSQALDNLETLWSSNKDLSITPLRCSESDSRGVKREQIDDVPGLLRILSNLKI